jgi:hypothetical protein
MGAMIQPTEPLLAEWMSVDRTDVDQFENIYSYSELDLMLTHDVAHDQLAAQALEVVGGFCLFMLILLSTHPLRK